MYLINKKENSIIELQRKTFTELSFRERENLQKWIEKNPNCLGEDLLIIQQEFDGFSDTNERLDLLALDKMGNLVIIENKLDDSGKDVTWQAVKYASYCSSLSKNEIIKIYQKYLGSSGNAESKLTEFFEGKGIDEISLNTGVTSQRIIMVAANFRKEVTSSVLWLSNFKMRIQCFKVSPFVLDEQMFLNIEQILPTKDAEEYTISMANKAQDELQVQETLKNRHHYRLEFWEGFLNEASKHTSIFSNLSPSKESWIALGLGTSGVTLNLGISGAYCRTEIYISKSDKDANKRIYDELLDKKSHIESVAGDKLVWERMDDNKASRIKEQQDEVNIFNKEDWPKMYKFLIDSSQKMEKAFRPQIKKLNLGNG